MNKIPLLIIAFIATVTYSQELPVEIHGSISQTALYSKNNHYIFTGSKDGSLDFTEVYINFSRQVSEKLRMGLQISSRNFGKVENFEPKIDWAYGDYLFIPEFGLRVGQVKVAYGIYNESRDIDFAKQSILLDQGVYPEDLRLLITSVSGASVYGLIDLSSIKLGDLEYQAFGGVAHIDTRYYWSDISAFNNNSPNSEIVDVRLMGVSAFINPFNLFKTGASYTRNESYITLESDDLTANIPNREGISTMLQGFDPITFPNGLPAIPLDYIKHGMYNKIHTYTYSLEFPIMDQFTVTSEYQILDLNFTYTDKAQEKIIQAYTDQNANSPFITSTYTNEIDPTNYSFYINLFHQTTDDLGLYTGFGNRILRFKYGAEKSRSLERDYMAGCNYFITDNVLAKLEYHYIDGNNSAYNPIHSAAEDSNDGHLGLARISFSF